jgi:succinoglycan biosynthesis protein ExoV
MKLVYFRSRQKNFGDDLNAALWPVLAPDLFDEDPQTGFVGIGTIIGMPVGALRRLHVFSSGIGNDPVSNWQGKEVRYWCVRGPISARVLGLEPDAALTDGAILVPGTPGFPERATGDGATLVIPHFETIAHPGWDAVARLTGYEVLDPRDDPAPVVARIARARLVLTESLHGAILADAYGVPWLAFGTSRNFGATKFVDWRASLGESFTFTPVPPPDASMQLQHGRPIWAFGERITLDLEQALRRFEARLASTARSPGGAKARLKALLMRAPGARRLLGLNPARTAEALRRLATQDPCGSRPAVRASLRERMAERLHAVQRSARAHDLV